MGRKDTSIDFSDSTIAYIYYIKLTLCYNKKQLF